MALSSEGWFMLPGMYGIAAPYWKETAPTLFSGKGEMPPVEVLMRAGMESIAFLVADILERLHQIPGFEIEQITAGGGVARPPLLRFQSDLLGQGIHHSSVVDATALGCALLTGLQTGFWTDTREVQNLLRCEEAFYPRLSASERQVLLRSWHEFLQSHKMSLRSDRAQVSPGPPT